MSTVRLSNHVNLGDVNFQVKESLGNAYGKVKKITRQIYVNS